MPSELDATARRTAVNEALARLDAVHAEDPAGDARRYHATLGAWVARLTEGSVGPSDALVLAAGAQHLARWRTPRSAYPEGLEGYKRWRSTLARKHADDARAILEAAGCDAALAERVAELITKKRLGRDAEVDTFEDAICLTFLELEFAAFAAKTDREKVVEIVRKTWAKMTDRGHAAAAGLLPGMAPELRAIVEAAIA